MFLLVTHVVSELRKARPHGSVLAWLNAIPESDLFISSIRLGEIQRGIELTREQNPAKALEPNIRALPASNWMPTITAHRPEPAASTGTTKSHRPS